MRIVEKTAWLTGVTLLATYSGIHLWSLQVRDAGITALARSRACTRDASQCQPTVLAAADTKRRSESIPETVEPDMALWSPQRIAAYREAMLQSTTPEAVLRIPSLNLVVPVFEGANSWNLNRGAARIVGTAQFDGPGNVGIAGHRDGFFRPLRNISKGDRMYVDTAISTEEYRVIGIQIVAPSDVSVLDPTLVPTVTLVTCYPFYYVGPAPQRFIVRAERVGDRSMVSE